MFDIADIDYVNKIDLSKGFQRFHIKWPLTDLIRPKYSSDFETALTDGQREIMIPWSLAMEDDEDENKNTWIGAKLETDEYIVPMVYRIFLSSSTNVLFDQSGMAVWGMNGNFGYGEVVPSSLMDEYPIDDLVLHIWMAIPKAILIEIDNNQNSGISKDDSSQKKSIDVFLSDAAKIFNRVTDTKANSSSDVPVIIVKTKVCAGRKRGIEEEVRRFHCHTSFLSARSSVFERMFSEAEWKENSVKNGCVVKIDDIKAHVMEMVLRYMYTSTLPDKSIEETDLYAVIYAADKYDLTELKNWCVGILILNHQFDQSRIDQLLLADRHNLVQLKSVCLAHLAMNFSTAFSDLALIKDMPKDLWSEIMKAVNEGQAARTEIELEEE